MNLAQQFTLDQSGKQFTIINTVVDASSLTVAYTVNGTTTTLTLYVLGVINASNQQVLLDTYTGNINTTRTVSLTQTFDSFIIVGSWQELGVSIGVVATGTGAGPSFTGGAPGQILVGIASPVGVVAAPVGTFYVNTQGSAGSVFFVKTSGSSTSGWSAVA